MKIYKIAQTAAAPNPQDTAAMQEITQAIATIQKSVAVINESLRTLEQNNISRLFQRDTFINELQSGNLDALDVNKINVALEAMSKIATVIPTLNAAKRVLVENEAAATKFNINWSIIVQNVIVPSIQKGDFSQFVSILRGFESMMPAMGGTVSPSNLSY